MRLSRALGSSVAGLEPAQSVQWNDARKSFEARIESLPLKIRVLDTMIQASADVTFRSSAPAAPAAPSATNASLRPPAGPGSPTRE